MGLKLFYNVQSIKEFNDLWLKPLGVTYNELKDKGVIMEPMRYKKYENTGFNTPSGKVELY